MRLKKLHIIIICLSVITISLIIFNVYKLKKEPFKKDTELLKPNENDIVFGSEEAQLSVYMYASYNCSYCRKFFTDILPKLQKEYLDTKKIKIVLRLTARTVDKRLKQSLKTLVCVNKYGNYQYLHELLLHNYKIIYTKEFQDMTLEFIQKDPFIGECIDGTEAESYLIKNIKEFESKKLRGTPTFIIKNTVYSGYRNITDFKKILNTHLKN